MISINNAVIENILATNQTEIKTIIDKAKRSVFEFRNNPAPINLNAQQQNYLDKLIAEFESIVMIRPNDLKIAKDDFDIIINGSIMASQNREFKNELLKRMDYSGLRNVFYAKYFEASGLKSCIYCNSQLAVTVRTLNGKRSAKFQVDHFYPKSDYPCFSISFFNLLPVCGSCNNVKRSGMVNFNVYSDDPIDLRESPFTFQIDKKSLVSYRVNGTVENLKIEFDDSEKKGYNDQFDIEGIYSTQKDLAEELILKALIYNKNYLESLRNSFKKLYPNKIPMAERLLVGNYTNSKDIHKRPMSKFTQDIARQLKLI
ncbi:HNH endonuclease domain-containing protein [Cellulophaga sp. Hel_I_12]|uniref:HNH endonuclease domain-containing protein n=1 Tax=Cellulophaga sp. Hel_I_12 TaxID=1249972 RepID=UPI0006487682|nr:HNH endonuclease domain-containing protein [Cellulophaga sp. Hel_I_12]